MVYFDRRKFDGSPLGVGYGSADAFWDMMDALVDGINEEAGTDHPPVSTEAQLAALTDYQDKMVILVEDEEGGYRFDAQSMAILAAHSVVKPTLIDIGDPGRWIKYTVLITDHNNLVGLQGGAAAEYYHFNNAEYLGLQTALGAGIQIATVPTAPDSVAGLDAFGVLYDSTILVADVALQVPVPAVLNLCGMDAAGNPTDSGLVISEMALRVAVPDVLNLCGMDADGDPTDSGVVISTIAERVAVPDVLNLCGMDADGDPTDSGVVISTIAERVAVPDVLNLCGMDADGDPTDSGLVISEMAQRVAVPDVLNLCGMDADGDPTDSGVVISTIAERVAVPDILNLCGMDADGDPTDSGLVVTEMAHRVAAPNILNLCGMDADGDPADSGVAITALVTAASQNVVPDTTEFPASAPLVATAVGCVGVIPISKNAADAADIQVTLPAGFDIRVLDVHVVKTDGAGGVGDSVQIMNGGVPITNVLDLNAVPDQGIVRAQTIDDAQHRVAGGTMLIADFDWVAGDNRCKVYVTFLRVA